VVRDFPLSSIHPFAQKASEATECADDQDKYWEYHDRIFENQAAMTVEDLKGYAQEMGLDTGEFDECLDSGKYEQEVLQDMQDGRAAGVSGTPAFFINGQLVSGAQPFTVFQQVIDELLAGEG
jgi:protein-disulfide isomerase